MLKPPKPQTKAEKETKAPVPPPDQWRKSDHLRLFARTVADAFKAENDADGSSVTVAGNNEPITIYALRHSSIVRQILRGVPVRVVAVLHDTSVQMIEKNYSKYLADHSDTVARSALLDLSMTPQ